MLQKTKTSMKQIEDDTSRWKERLCSWFRGVKDCQNDYTTQNNIQIQQNPYQIIYGRHFSQN